MSFKKLKNKKEEIFKGLSWIPKTLAMKVYDLDKLAFNYEDLQQELNISLWKAIESYVSLIKQDKKPKINISRYCYSSVMNEKINWIRKLNRNKRSFELLPIENKTIYCDSEDEFSKIKIVSKTLKIIVDGIDILDISVPDLWKQIFVDSLIGYNYTEISEIYGISISVVKNNIHKVRSEIKKKYFSILENLFKEKTFHIGNEIIEEGDEIVHTSFVRNNKQSFNRPNKFAKLFK